MVAWCLDPGKYRDPQLADKRIIPAPAVDDITLHAPEMQGFCREFAHESEAVILWLANNDLPFRRGGLEFSPSNATFMHTARCSPSPLHREHTPCYASFWIKRCNCWPQHAVFHPEFAHHVVKGDRLTFTQEVW